MTGNAGFIIIFLDYVIANGSMAPDDGKVTFVIKE